MGHVTEKHYTDLGGLDTRTNKLTQDPRTARAGSKNFRWNYQDELGKLNGFQHKTSSDLSVNQALLEYKYKDINTGESKSQLLSVGSDGNLYRLTKVYLKIIVTAASPVYYYSMIYDEVADAYKFIVYGSTNVALGTVTLSLSTTLNSLKASINALAITGLTADIVDEDLNPTTSVNPGYLLDTVVLNEFNKAGTDNEYNPLYSAVKINTPNGTVPFPTLVSYKDDANYQGISWQNLNNALYITDGGFLMKYDGYQVYRAGMPTLLGLPNAGTPATSVLGLDRYSLAVTSGGSLGSGIYKYKFQLGYVDPNGVEILGKILAGLEVDTSIAPGDAVLMTMRPIYRDTEFPVYSAQVNGDQDIAGSNQTFNVFSGHNIKAGMILRFPTSNGAVGFTGLSFQYCSVTSVTATSITLASVVASNDYPWDSGFSLRNNQWVSAGYSMNSWVGKITDIVEGSTFIPPIYVGAFIRVWRTKVDDGQYYHHSDHAAFQAGNSSGGSAGSFGVVDTLADSELTQPLDPSEGEDLPRAGKYIGEWQGFLIQGGAPYNQGLANNFYPTVYNPPISNVWGTSTMLLYQYYTQAHLCDFQSIFWNDALNPEGFPQSGLNEQDFPSEFNDQITGFLGNKDSLVVCKNRTTIILGGTIGDGNLVPEVLEADIGAVNIQSMALVRGSVVFLDEITGFWSVVAGRLPEFIGFPIEDTFKDNNIQSNSNFLNLKRAVATNFKADGQYICYIPAGKKESGDSGVLPDPTSASVAFVFDYSNMPVKNRAYWTPLKDINAFGGLLASANDELFFASHIGVNGQLWKQRRTGTRYDFCNHTSAVEWLYKTAFLTQGMPCIDKHYIQTVINSIQGGFSLVVQQYYNFLDYVKSSISITFAAESSSKVGVKKEVKCNNNKTQGLSLGFYNNDKNTYVRIQGWELELSAEFDHGEIKK